MTGSGENRAQVLKAAYQASPATTLDVGIYGSQTSAEPSSGLPATNAPAYQLGTHRAPSTPARSEFVPMEARWAADRIRGNQVVYDVPIGSELFTVGYDRSAKTSRPERPTSRRRPGACYCVVRRRSVPCVFSVADVLSSGSALPARGDPQAGLAFRSAERAHAAGGTAGSSYGTQPPVAANPAQPRSSLAPETAFAYHFSASQQVTPADALSLDAFRIDQFDAATRV